MRADDVSPIRGGDDGRPEAGATPPSPPDAAAERDLLVEIISDTICPWCFVGKRRFERAIAQLPMGVRVAVRWRPFELNPGMPAGGVDRRVYRSAKFGSWERAQARDAQVAAVGAREGIEFHHELIARTPRTFDAHRLVWLAEREGVQDAVVEALFRAYFGEGRDIGDAAVLAGLAGEAGIAHGAAAAMLAGDAGAAEVRAAEAEAHRQGVSGVPTFLIDGRAAFSGAQSSDLMLMHLQQAAES